MKKLLALLAFSALLSPLSRLNAQSYQIQDGVDVSNTTLTYWCDTANATFTTEYWLQNTSASVILGKSYKHVYQYSDPSAQFWWCVGINCFPANFVQGDTFRLNPGAGTWLTIDFNPNGHTGTSMVRYIIRNYYNSADSTYIDITYNMPGGLASVNAHAANTSGISVFPNPVADELTLNFANGNQEHTRINFYDLNGALIRSIETNGTAEQKVDVSELANGVYFIRMEQDGELSPAQKFVIAR